MSVSLIPVLEVQFPAKKAKPPKLFPFWEHENIWAEYYAKCFQEAGFTDAIQPYLRGSAFYKLADISDRILTKIVVDHTYDLRKGVYERDAACALYGGFVLQVKGQDKFFPQCCSDLSDIQYWERLACGENAYCEGHPAPLVSFEGQDIFFDFILDEFEDVFQPPCPELLLTINRNELQLAVESAKAELSTFQKRIEAINTAENLGIENIAGLLIWENPNQE